MSAQGHAAGPPTHTREAEVRLGEVLADRYRVTRLIGRGGMGVVVEAERLDLGELVAVKILHTRHLDNAEAVARFHHEARAAARVRGEHSIRLYDVGTTSAGTPFLVMELLRGRDLASVVEQGPLSVQDAALYVLQACEGMAEVHAHGIVHRDLKPANLFLAQRADGSPLVKVLDFGIAKGVVAAEGLAPALTQTLVSMGTPLYMSPEQIRSSRHVDARADVWSLGAIFYELLVGRPAFGGNTVTAITAQVLEGHPTPPSELRAGLPGAVDTIVATALAKNPDERYIDVAGLALALEPLAGPLGQGASQRIAAVLRGALRPDANTTPPVARDDALGGTMRFDRRKRAMMMRAAIGLLGLLAFALVVAAVGTYRASLPKAASARQGLRTAALVPAAAARAVATNSPARSAGTDEVVELGLDEERERSPASSASSRVVPPRPTSNASSARPAPRPDAATPKPAASAGFDPFADRN